jgi:hypothetical protein
MHTDPRENEINKKSGSAKTSEKNDPTESWKNRLSLLPPDEQAHIAKKYYGGHYPWKG